MAESQTRQAFANIGALLDVLEAGPEHVVKLLTFVSGTEHHAPLSGGKRTGSGLARPRLPIPVIHGAILEGLRKDTILEYRTRASVLLLPTSMRLCRLVRPPGRSQG